MTTILIVDDHETNRYMLEALLEGHGYTVRAAANGKEALNMAQSQPPELAISDILMPEMDGFALCRRWQEDERLQKIPFIFYTATYTDAKDEAFALSLGAACFIVKPVEPETLLQTVQSTLKNHKRKQPANYQAPATQEATYFRLYNEALVRKLEDKMMQVEQANQRLNMFYEISTRLASLKQLDELLSHALNTVVVAMGHTYANYFSFNEKTRQFHLMEAVGYGEQATAAFQQQLIFTWGEERGLVGLVGKTGKPLVVPDTHADPRWLKLDENIRSALFLPVSYESRLLGVVSILSRKKDAFNDENVRDVTTLMNNVAIAIDNAHLYQAQQKHASRLEAEVATRTVELREALERAQAADRLKSQFLSDVNHELRTPLSNIKLYLTLLEQGQDANRPRYLEVLNREIVRLQYLIEDMLDLSRLDSGKTAVDLMPVDLNQLIASLVIERGELARDKDVSVDFEPAEGLPLVRADKQLLFQVLANLLANAMNYTAPGGAIVLRTETAVSAETTRVLAHISDTGPGIAEEEQAKLFDRFFRGGAGRASGVPGTGLGLAICHEIIQRHGGKITVESDLGSGSTFTVWLQQAASA